MRALLATVLTCALLPLGAGLASAEPTAEAGVAADRSYADDDGWVRKPLVMVPHAPALEAAGGDPNVSDILFVNRCRGGCTVIKAGNNNALTNESTIPVGNDGQMFQLSEFSHGDTVWNTLMQCLRDVYGPYKIQVVDEDPGNVPHHEAIAAGLPSEINRSGIGGIAPGGCTPRNNVISYSFLNDYPASQVYEMCATVAQESAHSYGLADHIFDCTDPMTYLVGCGRKYFRNKLMPCGEFQQADCQCTGTRQNPHIKLLAVFGEGTQPPPPTVSIAYPAEGATIQTMLVRANATDPRGVYKVELYLNGWRWHTYTQPDMISPPYTPPTMFDLNPGSGVPNSRYDIEVRAYNDLGAMSVATGTAIKGAPCGDASACLTGQKCEDGKCFWDQPTGQLGDACTYPQQCAGPNTYDGRCETAGDVTMCTRACYTGVNDDCPDGFACLATDTVNNTGICWIKEEEGGCCSAAPGTSGGAGTLVAPLLLAAGVGGLALRRRRRA